MTGLLWCARAPVLHSRGTGTRTGGRARTPTQRRGTRDAAARDRRMPGASPSGAGRRTLNRHGHGVEEERSVCATADTERRRPGVAAAAEALLSGLERLVRLEDEIADRVLRRAVGNRPEQREAATLAIHGVLPR